MISAIFSAISPSKNTDGRHSLAVTVAGVIDCQNNQSCQAAGADGQVITFEQDLQLVVDAGAGRADGQIIIDLIGAGFMGPASGYDQYFDLTIVASQISGNGQAGVDYGSPTIIRRLTRRWRRDLDPRILFPGRKACRPGWKIMAAGITRRPNTIL